jgi:glycosyltransferase involved in cell wall biosynthesis
MNTNGLKDEQILISVIIPVHNGGTDFLSCLDGIIAATGPLHEIIVVSDGDPEAARLARGKSINVLELPQKGGPARARNVGAKSARGNVLFFIDADVVVPQNAVDFLSEIFNADQDLAAVIGSYDKEPGAPDFLSQYKNLFHHYVHQNGRQEGFTFWGACGAIRRSIFLEMGGFNERYTRPSIEDIELGYRLRAARYCIRLCKELEVKHLKQWTPVNLIKTDFSQRALPWLDLMFRHKRLDNDLNIDLASRLSVLCVWGLIAVWVLLDWEKAALSTLVLASILLILNASFYRFYHQHRGFYFALKVLPWHWLYFFYSGLAVGRCRPTHLLKIKRMIKNKRHKISTRTT